MGFWKTLKFWDPQAIIETTIETTQKTFLEEKRKHPDRDPHACLALTYGLRGGYTADPLISFTRTMMYSVLGDDAPTGLAYYFLKQEMPAALPKFKAEMERLTAPALKLIRQRQFVGQWEALNPWTAANVPGIREVVAESAEALAREMFDSQHGIEGAALSKLALAAETVEKVQMAKSDNFCTVQNLPWKSSTPTGKISGNFLRKEGSSWRLSSNVWIRK